MRNTENPTTDEDMIPVSDRQTRLRFLISSTSSNPGTLPKSSLRTFYKHRCNGKSINDFILLCYLLL